MAAEAEPVSLELVLAAVHEIRDEVRTQRTDLDALKRQVNGSGKPPPPDEDDGAPVQPIATQLTEVRKELKRQSTAMGLAGFAEWLASPGAAGKAVRIAGVLSTFYTALHVAGIVK